MFTRTQHPIAIETTGLTPMLRTRAKRLGRLVEILGFLVSVFVVAIAAGSLASAADNDDSYKTAQGLAVYLGVLPAAIVRGHLESHPEATMHGGAPQGKHEDHVVVAVFDAKTGARIENARVTANVSGLGHVGAQNIDLEAMSIAGTVTYGNFVELPGNDRYDIKLNITVPGRKPASVQIDFTYQHLQ
ncbi:hypothetical protein RFN28_05480 [Mesorhizobium sp. VK24D]|uniref:DUF4426 domain-containing protein n=1 Tax=Mesorhizobium album TaxID=3072314 RepID=A0ABU4XTB0_9HYPH|nr:hypothetical protein [Mesorhizobium sp. VK24D]MDX8477934.1 hypothetical protein [Mesorhizobium sp. VK24D]